MAASDTNSRPNRFLLARFDCLAFITSLLLWTNLTSAAPLEVDELPAPLEERSAASQPLQDRLHAAALFAAGRVLEQRDENSNALRKYQRAHRYDPNPAVLHDILRLAAALDRSEEAVRYALLNAEQLATDSELLRPLALVLTQQGDWEQAYQLYEVLLRQYSTKASPLPATATTPAVPVLPDFTELTIRQEAARLSFLNGKFAEGAAIGAPIEAALADPIKYQLTEAQQKELLGEAGLTYHLFAECHLAAAELDAAAKCFEIAHQHQKNEGLHGYNMARVALKQGQFARGREQLQKYFTAQLGGEGAAPYTLLKELLAGEGKADQFDAELQTLRKADPENASLALFVAQRLLETEKYDEAEPIYAALAKTTRKRNLDEVYAGLIQCRAKQAAAEPLLVLLGEAEAKMNASDWETALAPIAADEKLRKQLLELARQRRSPSAGKLPPANEAWVICELSLVGKDLAVALEFFDFALQDQPARRGELLETFGVMLFLADHTAAAAKVFERGLDDEKLKEERTSFQFYLAGALAFLDRTEEALKHAQAAAEADPEDPRFTMRVAWVLQRAQHDEEALTVYLALLNRMAEQYDSLSTRDTVRELRQTISNLYVRRNDRAAGVEQLELVLDEFPADVGALNDLGYLWAEDGQHLQRAKRMIEQAVAAEPDNRAYLDSLGWVQYQLGNYEAAKVALEKALQDEPEPDSVMLEHLGDVYAKLNDPTRAKAQWQRALEALPKDADQKRRAALEQKLQ